MNKFDACRVLGIDGELSLKVVKTAYRLACSKFHPDRNPAGLEMMKLVNNAYDFLKTLDFDDEKNTTHENDSPNYGDELNTALNMAMELEGLIIELCGVWIWISGDTKTHKAALKEAGYKWAAKKKQWYFRPAGFKSRGYKRQSSMEEIRGKYGSRQFNPKQRARVTA